MCVCACLRACVRVCMCAWVCVLRYCSVPTCGGVKSRWWGGRRCSDLGAPRGEMIKRPRGAGKGGSDAQTQPHSSSKHSSDSIHYKCVPLYCQHRKMVSEDSFPCSLQKLSLYLKVVKENLCPSLPPTLPLTPCLPLSQCPVVGWLLRSRCVWVAVITGTQVPLAHGV